MKILIIVLLNLSIGFGCGEAQIAYSKKSKKELHEEYQRQTGNEVSYRYFCFKYPRNLKRIVITGSFAHDVGCIMEGLFVDGKWGTLKDMMQKGLEINGWGDKSKRKELALHWVKEIVLGWNHSVNYKHKDFELPKAPQYNIPTATLNESGDISVLLWVRKPPGMRPVRGYYQLSVTISEDARITDRKILKFYSVPLRRSR